MKLVSLTIPDDIEQWPAWLERQLIGLYLSDLIDELKIIAPTNEPVPTLDEVIGGQWEDLLDRGLSAVEFECIRMLIRHPELLPELQERVFIDGGAYWQDLPVDEEVQASADRVTQRVKAALAIASESAPMGVTEVDKGGSHSSRRIYLIAAALAASVLLVLGVRSQFPSKSSVAFAWEHPDSLDSRLPPSEYGAGLSKSLEEWWFSDRPETKEELSDRLQRFRDGCETLIAAKHPQLTDDQREQLVTKCRNWLKKIDGHLADVKKGSTNVTTMHENSDETVRATVDALQKIFS